MNYSDLSSDNFDRMAERLVQQVKKRKFKAPDNKIVGISMARQMLSQSLFAQPYEAIKNNFKTSVNNIPAEKVLPTSIDNKNKASSVLILQYGNDAIITVDGTYFKSLSPATDAAITFNELESLAKTLSSNKKESFSFENIIQLPQILSDNWEYESVISLAVAMGYISHKETIFDLIQDYTEEEFDLLLDGEVVEIKIPLDWDHHFKANADKKQERNWGENPSFKAYMEQCGDFVIWDTFILGHSNNICFTFNELCNATYNPHSDSWDLSMGGINYTLTCSEKRNPR